MCVHVSDPDAVVLVMCVLIVAAQAVAGAGQCAWSPCRELHRGARRGLVSAQSWGPVSASPSHLAPPPWCPAPQLPLGCHLSLYGTSAHTGVIYTVSGRPHGGLLVLLTPLTVGLWFTPPGSLTQAIRNFAKSLEGWLINAMSGFPQQVIQTKVWIWGPLTPLCSEPLSLSVAENGPPEMSWGGKGAGRERTIDGPRGDIL